MKPGEFPLSRLRFYTPARSLYKRLCAKHTKNGGAFGEMP